MPGANQGRDRDLENYLARIRKTIAESNALISQAELRIAETDRMLERQGLTREQVLAMRFSDAQIEAANEELRRRGLDPLERWEEESRPAPRIPERRVPPSSDSCSGDEVENRQRKFGMMMKPFQI